jgi:hypothetical protein
MSPSVHPRELLGFTFIVSVLPSAPAQRRCPEKARPLGQVHVCRAPIFLCRDGTEISAVRVREGADDEDEPSMTHSIPNKGGDASHVSTVVSQFLTMPPSPHKQYARCAARATRPLGPCLWLPAAILSVC